VKSKHLRQAARAAILAALLQGLLLAAAPIAGASTPITPGGPAVTVTAASGQNPVLTFTGDAGQRVSLKMTDRTIGSGCCSLKVSLLKPNGTTLVSPTYVGAQGGFFDTRTLPSAGTYKIVVDPQGTASGSLTLQLFDVPADLSGSIAAGGAAQTVTLATPGRNARLAFSGTAGQRVSATLSGVSMSSVRVSLLKADGTQVGAYVNVGTGGGFLDTRALPVTGSYKLLVNPQGAATGNITLTLHDVPADVSGTIVPGGGVQAVTVGTPGQNGKLTFTGTAGKRVALKVSGVTIGSSSCCGAKVSIVKPDGTALVPPTFVGTSGGWFDTKTLPAGGTYKIVVNPQGAATGSATLTLYDVPANVSGTIAVGGPSQTVTISTPGQNAKLTFTGSAGAARTLVLSGVSIGSGCCGSKVSVLKPDGTTLVPATFVGTSGRTMNFTLTVAGTYSIVVDPQYDATGSMTLQLS